MSLCLPAYWDGRLPDPTQALLIVSLGLYGGVGHFLLIRAFREAPVATLSPLLYIQLIWATLLGWAVFDHLPDFWAVVGMAIIGTSGLALFWSASGARRQPRGKAGA